ncbi:MAG TPA: phytoene/squalene synthase family protein [Streptosporangiaceae bacterium]|jgi:phytoene synthase
MIAAELDAAGLTDPRLRAAYQRCRELNAQHGRTYYLATKLLTRAQRPAVHALYGFARWADDIVDDVPPGTSPAEVAARLDRLGRELFDGLARGHSDDPILAAVVDTARRYQLDPDLFTAFMDSMRMDLEVTSYPDRAALDRYVHGSAEVIGLQVLPVLGTVGPRHEAAPYAAALGQAFQLTNFLRDVAEDLDLGRVYLPADELAAFGVDTDLLRWCRARQRTDPRVRAALADQHATTRAIYRYAQAGITRLQPVSRPCVATALALYAEILDRIEDLDFAVFAQRARVGPARRLRVAAPALARAMWARRGHRATMDVMRSTRVPGPAGPSEAGGTG